MARCDVLGYRCDGKLSKYYDNHEIKISPKREDNRIMNRKDICALLYLYDKFGTDEAVAKECGLKPTTLRMYGVRLRTLGLIRKNEDRYKVIEEMVIREK